MAAGKIKITKACDNIIIFSLYAVAFFLPISKAIIESLSTVSIVAYVIKKFVNFQGFPKSRLNFGIFAYLTVSALSILLSSNSSISSRTFFAKTLQDIAFFFVVIEALDEKNKISNLLHVLLLSSLLLGIDGIYQHFTSRDFLRHRPFIDSERISASFVTPNAFGCYLTTVIPFLTARFLSVVKAKASRFIYFALFSLLFICLLLTTSRGAWLAFLASALYMSAWLKSAAVFLSVLGIVLLITHIFYPPYVRERLLRFFSFSDTSGVDRQIIWQAGWKMFVSKPWLGLGLGTFMFNFKQFVVKDYPYGIVYAHNCYLQMAAEIGIIGLASFLLILALFFGFGIKMLNTAEKTFSWYVLLASQAAILGYCAQMGVDTTLYALDLGMLFWLVLGIGTAAMKNLQSACDTRK